MDPNLYVKVEYYVESLSHPRDAAIALAREQSATVTSQAPYGLNINVEKSTARVVKASSKRAREGLLPPYRFNAASPKRKAQIRGGKIEIAFPVQNFGASLTNLWNAVGGEIHRLGFITAARILSVEIPPVLLQAFAGPKAGVSGIREYLGVWDRPLLCRSTRPAVGLTTAEMVKINERVLAHGFDVVKDDELTCDTPLSEFRSRVSQMVEMIARVNARTNERKLYVANVIADGSKAVDYAGIAAELGAGAVLVAPGLQGVSICAEIARSTNLLVLAHNSWEDVVTRHPRFGISPAALITLHRLSGCDMILLPATFAAYPSDSREEQQIIGSCLGELGGIRPTLPVLAGGKKANEMRRYAKHVRSLDFMLIVATALDQYPKGVAAGAEAFRLASLKLTSSD